MTRDPLTPSAAEVEVLRDQVGEGPVIILNLLKYREPGGREAFGSYAALSGPLLALKQAKTDVFDGVRLALAVFPFELGQELLALVERLREGKLKPHAV